MLWLFQSLAISAGMYGAQIWSTPLLHNLLTNSKALTDVHRRHVGFLKRVLGVKRSVSSWVALRESGQMPMHFYWLKATIRFWNAMVVFYLHEGGNSGMHFA